MRQLYKSELLPTAKRFYGTDNSKWILLEDNDQKHKSGVCTDFKEENGIVQMDWPAQSPDCNPIEKIWSIMKQRLKGKHIRSIQHLTSFLKRQWNSLPREYAEKLSKIMHSRCERVIAKQGEWIDY